PVYDQGRRAGYDGVDRIVLNGYFGLAYPAGGFRKWWRRLHGGSDDSTVSDGILNSVILAHY
ncbi:MAG: hypothetical protein ACREV1_09215, partial [Gammaproteobacteria bacterium]